MLMPPPSRTNDRYDEDEQLYYPWRRVAHTGEAATAALPANGLHSRPRPTLAHSNPDPSPHPNSTSDEAFCDADADADLGPDADPGDVGAQFETDVWPQHVPVLARAPLASAPPSRPLLKAASHHHPRCT